MAALLKTLCAATSPGVMGSTRRSRVWGWLVTWAVAFGAVAPVGVAGQTPPRGPTPPAAASEGQEFEEMCRAWTQGSNHFFGRAQADQLRRRLDAGGLDIPQQVELSTKLGQRLLQLGETEEAVELVQGALEVAQRHGAPPRVLQILRFAAALAHLRLAEDQNCVANHGQASCIVPVAPEAVHSLTEHTRRAEAQLKAFLDEQPADPLARWLYNIARLVAGDAPDEVAARFRLPPMTSEVPFPRWRNVAATLGVDSLDLAGGAVMDDFDGDGLLDLVSTSWDPCQPMKAFRNDGLGGFEDVGAAWGLDQQLGGLNLMHADFNNDGRLDLLVLRGAWLGEHGRVRNSLLRNDLGQGDGGTGRFVDVTLSAGLSGAFPTQTAAWADYDLDGDLDLYVGNEADDENAFAGELYRNNGDGTFADVAMEAGVTNLGLAKGVAWGDYANDGDPDLFICNMSEQPNRLYRNNGLSTTSGEAPRITFTDVAQQAGVAEPVGRSFPTWFFDFDNDGDLDLLVAAYSASPATVAASYFGAVAASGQPLLYRNDGDGTFTEIGVELGLGRPLLPMGSNFGDLDNDGNLDLYFGTGSPPLESVMPNVVYRGDGGGRFYDVTAAGGFGHLQKGHGVAFGDLDNDGDQDIFQQIGGAFPVDAYYNGLFENPGTNQEAGWVTLRLEGRKANRFAVGARLEVVVIRASGERRSLHRVVGSGGSFGGSSLQQEIGLADAEKIERVVVRWPGGGPVQRFEDVTIGRVYRLVEGEDALVPVELPKLQLGSAAGQAGHRH
ncbi:MAG: CRTAC1 family protein [Acidobacteriota bacterium]